MMELREDVGKPKGCENCKFLKICNGGQNVYLMGYMEITKKGIIDVY
ncbi:hypothetical protein [Clostridium sp. LP20]